MLIPKLDGSSPVPQYVQLYEHIKHEIVSGRLAENDRLPSVRKLADFLDLSTTPIELAYQQLVAEGFVESEPRRGLYVRKLPEPYARLGNDGGPDDGYNGKRAFPTRDNKVYEYDFHLSKNDFTHFPFQTWRKLFRQALCPERSGLLFYGDPQGEPGLRHEIAKYLHRFRGVACSPEQIVIGADQHLLLNFLSMMLKDRSGEIAFENPGYVLFSSTFRKHGYRIVPISLEEDGIDIRELYASGVKLVSVSPSHQFPRGMIMPISKRLQLLEWADQTGGYIIEDDYDGEFRYHGRPIPSLQGLRRNGNVIYLGGFSQVLAPALCVNYMVLPYSLLEEFRRLQHELLFEQSSSPLHQTTLQLFMEKGFLEKHIRKMRNVYRKKHDLLIDSIRTHFGENANVIGKDAGFHILLEVDSPKPEEQMVREAKEAGIRVGSAAFAWLSPPATARKEFFIGFGGIPLERIDAGIKLLSDIWL